MVESFLGRPPCWRVREALGHELDLALSLALSDSLRPLVPSFAEALTQLPARWFERGRALLGGLEGDVFSLLGHLATAFGVPFETDYETLTLGLRERDTKAVAEACRGGLAQLGVDAPADAPAASLLRSLSQALAARTGSAPPPGSEGERRLVRECELAVALCRGGAAHARFWYWLDEFQHHVYASWRTSRAPVLAAQRERARASLGSLEGRGLPPVDWLTPMSPLRSHTPLREAVGAGALSVVFHVEPFGTWDVRANLPGALLVTFGEPGALYVALRSRAEDIAARLKALSDASRLLVLRVVRAASVDNGDVAAYLDLSEATTSVHARVLREAGLLQSHREGRRVLHQVDAEGVRKLLREVESFLGLRLETTEPGEPEVR